MKVYVVTMYDSIFDSTTVDKIFKDKQKAAEYMKSKNYYDCNPDEYEVIE